MGKTLYDKLWESHLVETRDDGTALIYIDRQLLHEVTSPQAFEGLRLAGRQPWRISANIAVPDHNVSTKAGERAQGLAGVKDQVSRIQLQTLDDNCAEYQIPEIPLNDERQGIVHVMGPEQGATLPGMTIVCGDSHTSTHGAMAALAHGIGTSDVEHALATGCLIQRKMKNFRVSVDGELSIGVTGKDIALAVVGAIGTAGGTGFAIEFAGSAIRALSMEGRMTLCNMAIEAGARVGLVAVDDKTLSYVAQTPFAPGESHWDQAEIYWRTLHSDADAVFDREVRLDAVSDADAVFDREVRLDAATIQPQVTWGTSPEMVTAVSGRVPKLEEMVTDTARQGLERALFYMGLEPGMSITDIKPDVIFIGSCTNSRIEDMRAAAAVLKGKRIAANISQALVVPGSGLVKKQAEAEGLDQIFKDAGMEWREPGCSMCLAMNADKLEPGQRCASTSNRNFEGRQGFGGRTHLVSPAMAAAAAVAGHFIDVRDLVEVGL